MEEKGRWIVNKEPLTETSVIGFKYKITGYRCSVCGKVKENKGLYMEKTAFCPNCGAKMERGTT